MLVVGSMAISEKERVFHKRGCIYEKRIKTKNRLVMKMSQAEDNHYRECAYCCGLRGEIRTSKRQMLKWVSDDRLGINYVPETDTLYIGTSVGFWKIFMLDEYKRFVLYHRNYYYKDMDFNEAIHGNFHRQKDVNAKDNIEQIVNYIIAHDKAKTIILDDYHKLPRRTKRQKKYYNQAKRRERRQSVRRLDMIFQSLEAQNPELKYAYKELAYC